MSDVENYCLILATITDKKVIIKSKYNVEVCNQNGIYQSGFLEGFLIGMEFIKDTIISKNKIINELIMGKIFKFNKNDDKFLVAAYRNNNASYSQQLIDDIFLDNCRLLKE